MRNLICPNCSAELAPSSRFCGVCGARVDGGPADPPRPAAKTLTQREYNRRRTIGFVVLAAALLVIGVAVASRQGSQINSPRDVTTDAKIICQDFVRERLRAPATASFASYATQSATTEGDGSIQVSGYVDAQNSFGANIRTTYVCTVRSSSSGDWSLVSLTTSP